MYRIILSDALKALRSLPEESVDCCVTSPPYYGLRDYGVDGQIGLEETPAEYISKLVEVFREVRCVLKDYGTLWLNMGDSYAGSGKGRNADGTPCSGNSISREENAKFGGKLLAARHFEYKHKDLMGIPWELALALRNNGWYLRQDIIWYKSPTVCPRA